MFTPSKDSNTAAPRDISAARDTMSNEGGHPLNDAKDKVRHFKEDARETANAVKEDLQDAARRTGKHVRDLADSAGQNLNEITDTLSSRIRKEPLKAAAVIAGVGFFFGMLYSRR